MLKRVLVKGAPLGAGGVMGTGVSPLLPLLGRTAPEDQIAPIATGQVLCTMPMPTNMKDALRMLEGRM